MAEHSAIYGSFSIEREFDVPVEKVWAVFADLRLKEKWFKGPDGAPGDHTMEFHSGGRTF